VAKGPSLKASKDEAHALCGEADDLIARIYQEARDMDRAAGISGAGARNAWNAIEARYADIKRDTLDLARRMEGCEAKLYLTVSEGAFFLGGALWMIGAPSAAASFIVLTGPVAAIALWGGVASAAGGGILFGKDLPEVTQLWLLRRRLREKKEGLQDALKCLQLAHVILAL
tara:strand:- start:943 stop:1458 length:516 start_codon:yes stop_codon:yes gene_type:complete